MLIIWTMVWTRINLLDLAGKGVKMNHDLVGNFVAGKWTQKMQLMQVTIGCWGQHANRMAFHWTFNPDYWAHVAFLYYTSCPQQSFDVLMNHTNFGVKYSSGQQAS